MVSFNSLFACCQFDLQPGIGDIAAEHLAYLSWKKDVCALDFFYDVWTFVWKKVALRKLFCKEKGNVFLLSGATLY